MARSALLLAFTDSYVLPGSVALDSALSQAPAGTPVFIGVVDASGESIGRLGSIGAARGSVVEFVDVTDLVAPFPGIGRYPQMTWARVQAPSIVGPDIDRVVYLDADILVRRPIDHLFDAGFDGNPLIAAPDPQYPTLSDRGEDYRSALGGPGGRDYFNTGVMAIDVAEWRRRRIAEAVIDMVERRAVPLDLVDQDALNAVLDDSWTRLDRSWNASSLGDVVDPAIVQFVGDAKPWNGPTGSPYDADFAAYATRLAGPAR